MLAGGGSIYDGPAARAKHRADFVLHRQQDATNIDVADLSIMLDGLLGCEQSEVAFAARIVEGNMQGAEARDSFLDQGDDVLLPSDICLYEEGLSAGRLGSRKPSTHAGTAVAFRAVSRRMTT